MSRHARVIDIEKFKFPPQPWYTVHDAFCQYSAERLIAKGKGAQGAWTGFNWFFEVVPPYQDAAAITTGQVEDFIDLRLAAGCSPLTPRRELTFIKAAIKYAHRRNRIAVVPYIELPEGETKYRRPLTEEEFRLVMKQPMSKRLRRFYWVAYFTGARSAAIEELEWTRVDMTRRTLDFNVPGRLITNKRRTKDFPIIDEFATRLVAWKADSKDRYVIGRGASTYNEAVHVVRERAGLTDPTLVPRHCMRKKFATDLFARKADPELAGKLMSDHPNTLRKNYVTHSHDRLQQAAALIVSR